jgi:nitrate/nitrite-specific signal transduction histidine kinase
MSVGAAHIHQPKIGTCPHGMPMGACPICSGMAGGNSTTKRDTPRNVGEMTYNQCAAIGAMLKAQKAAQHRAQASQQGFIQSMVQFQKNLEGIHQRIIDLAANISKSMPAIISAPVNFVLTQVVARIVNIMSTIPNVMANFAQKFVDIADKLAAVYGELKAAVSKSLSNLMSGIKKKLKSIFFVFGADEADDNDKKIDETKKAFNLKTFLHKLSRKFKRDEERIAEYEH